MLGRYQRSPRLVLCGSTKSRQLLDVSLEDLAFMGLVLRYKAEFLKRQEQFFNGFLHHHAMSPLV